MLLLGALLVGLWLSDGGIKLLVYGCLSTIGGVVYGFADMQRDVVIAKRVMIDRWRVFGVPLFVQRRELEGAIEVHPRLERTKYSHFMYHEVLASLAPQSSPSLLLTPYMTRSLVVLLWLKIWTYRFRFFKGTMSSRANEMKRLKR